jgi:hypothetical protein
MAFALHMRNGRKRGGRPGVAPPPVSQMLSTISSSAVLVLLCAGACLVQACYLGRINNKPTVQIHVPGEHFARGQTVEVTATGKDPDNDSVHWAWYVIPGPCAATLDPTALPSSRQQLMFDFVVPLDASTSCVWVMVTDVDGASDTASATISTVNRPPTAVISVSKPSGTNQFGRYDLYSRFDLSSVGSSDADGDAIVKRTWTPSFPPTAGALVPCSTTPPADQEVCFDAGNVPGDYVVSLVLNDGTDDSAPAQVRLTVDPDHPPCISDTDPLLIASPIVVDPAADETFKVQGVLDDGSPYPAPTDGRPYVPISFAWSMRRNGGAWVDLTGFDQLNKATLAGGSSLSGDVVDVRVTVSDGVAFHPTASCDAMCPTGCPTTATWTVRYR